MCGLSRSYILIYVFQNKSNNKNSKCVNGIARNIPPSMWLRFATCESNKNLLTIQSADVEDSTEATGDTHEVLTFVDEAGSIEHIESVWEPIISSGVTDHTSLSKFLGRPTLINTYLWSTADLPGLIAKIEPWYLFLNNAIIKQKLTNYAFIRASLHVKIVLNATPFHFGLGMIAYEPNVNAANTGDRSSRVRTNPVSNLPQIVTYSQMPHCYLYPSDNSGGEIHVPYFRPTSWLPLTSASAAKSMGTLTQYVVAPLQVATTSGSTVITVDTFAWLEDIELSGSTAELTLQGKDEYDGFISKPASALASVASSLTNAPVIGKFARATEIGASAVAGIASIFGYTNVPNIKEVCAVVPTTTPHLASSEISTPIQKLTLDPKQELSVDPTLLGVGSEDEMVISTLVQKESFLTVSSWSTSDLVGTVLWNADISPMLFSDVDIVDAGLNQKAYRVYHTPMSYLGMMFTHWRGDIIVEFDVLCTKFHKGRLKIAWDPLGGDGTLPLPENTVYTTVLDVGVNNKATFRVPFHQAYEWLRTRGISRQNWSYGNSLPVNPQFDNGLLIVSVLTPLMSPVSPQNVNIKISIRAAENFEFVNPSECLGESSSTQPPSFFDVQGLDVVDTQQSSETMGDQGSMHPQRYALNFGEKVVSLRTLLHRYSLYDVSFPGTSSATKSATITKSYSRLPPSFGFDPTGLSSANKVVTLGTANFNFTPTHPITYVSAMYGAARGSVNYVVNFSQDLQPYIGDARVQRITDNTHTSYRRGTLQTPLNTGSNNSVNVRHLLYNAGSFGTCAAGAAFTNTQTNGTLAFNQPHMSSTNFNFPDTKYSNSGNVLDQSDLACVLLQVTQKQITNSIEYTSFNTYAGSGPDYHCVWFLGCPTVDYYTATIAAA